MIKFILCFTFFCCFGTISYSQDKRLLINEILITGNRTTKEKIITRELSFKISDTVTSSVLEQQIRLSKENLMNTSLFNYVTITVVNISDSVNIIINVEERWYTWPSVILKYDDRNFSAWLKAKDLSKSRYGFSIEKYNCFGRKENLRFSLLFGYATQFALSYRNIALDNDRKHFIGLDMELTRQDEIIIGTRENEPVRFRNNFNSEFELRKYTLNYVFRPYINHYHKLYINYLDYRVADTILKLNPDFLGNNIRNMKCFTFDYVYSDDKRDNKAYPLNGYYFEMLLGQTVSIPLSDRPFVSTVIIPSFNTYKKINNNLFYALGINLKFSYSAYYSYMYSKALGYNYNLHGFEYNTIEGQHFIMIKNLLKISILKPRISELPFIPLKKFNKIHYALYFNVFADCGYVANKYSTTDNNYANRFLFSTGAGFDLVTYYDRTLRADYSVNGFGRGGFYLHLTAPII